MLSKKVEEVLQVLHKEGILNDLILIGSWSAVFYKEYYKNEGHFPVVRTLDLDFLIPRMHPLSNKKFDVGKILDGLGFIISFNASGWTRFNHPDIRIEFLVPLLGPRSAEPVNIADFKLTAQPIRHISILTTHTIRMNHNGIFITLAHPIAFALHKLFVSQKRSDKEKAKRDIEMGSVLLKNIQRKHDPKEFVRIWKDFTPKEQKIILNVLRADEELKNLMEIVEG